jgi:hypothetical protein
MLESAVDALKSSKPSASVRWSGRRRDGAEHRRRSHAILHVEAGDKPQISVDR